MPAPAVNSGPALVSMAQQFTGLPMRSLIGGPLKAAAEANSTMAVTQTKFMLDTCFNSIPKTKTTPALLEPIMVTMHITRGVIAQAPPVKGKDPEVEIKNVKTTFDIPLLTLVPLNSLGVTNVQVDFDMEVKSSYSDESSQSNTTKTDEQGSFDAKLNYGIFSVEIKGSVSHSDQTTTTQKETYKKSNDAKYTVSVTASQLDLPKGVTTIIDAFAKSITPITLGDSTSEGTKS